MIQASPAVVLRSGPWKEIDRVVTFFSRDYGKIRGIARGGARSRKRFGGGLDPFTHVNLYFRAREHRDLIQVELCEEIESFPGIRNDISRFGSGFYLLELTSAFFPEQESSPEVFALLLWGLGRLNDGDDPGMVVRKFEIRLIDLAGYRPKVRGCRMCGREARMKGEFLFLPGDGEIVCTECKGKSPATEISGESLAVLYRVPRLGWSGLSRLRLSPRVNRELGEVLSEYISCLLNKGEEFHSKIFLDSIRRDDKDRGNSNHREVLNYG